jgi:hypothetical protein
VASSVSSFHRPKKRLKSDSAWSSWSWMGKYVKTHAI